MMKLMLVVLGFISLILAVIGVFIPILPTTPFLLLSAACFLRGSDRAYQWLMNHRLFGEYIRNFRDHKAIPLRTKIISVSLLWITILFSIFFVAEALYLRVMLAIIAIAVTAHILHFNTLSNTGKNSKQE